MVVATPAPKVRHPSLLVVPYAYALCLIILAVFQLMGLGGFDFAGIKYQTLGLPSMIATIAGLEIFALPFVLRLELSRAARFMSALFSLAAPLFYAANVLYLGSQDMLVPSAADWVMVLGLVALGFGSFYVLNGIQALSFSTPKSRRK